ncbi:MAG: flagellar protein FlaG [Spirochaetes bacterium]|nr:flagellar protein FlaG [Spirochaetota bacterium]
MSMEVTGIPFRNIESPQVAAQFLSAGTSSAEQQTPQGLGANPTIGNTPFLLAEQNLKELEGLTRFLNRRLKFSFNEELQQVVVKIVDGETDKVIKVLPPEEVQKLHLRIRETLGILFDQLI